MIVPKPYNQLFSSYIVLHEAHPGISWMKTIAHSYFRWNGFDQDIGVLGKPVKHSPPAAPLYPWVWPDAPRKCVHIDRSVPQSHVLFGSRCSFQMARSHNYVVHHCSQSHRDTLFYVLTLQITRTVVSDNGLQFTSVDFAQFMSNNGSKHINSAPHHPASNGLVEGFVQTLKRPLKAGERDGKTIHH